MAERSTKRATERVKGVPNLAEEGPPLAKKLRSSDQDLKIIVKDIDEEGDVIAEKEYHVYSQVYAKHSKFVDTSLAVDMREKETREIIFHGVSPDTFELAMKYLEDPTSVITMDEEKALNVVGFYDKYEFTAGIKICDCILTGYVYQTYKKMDALTPKAAVDKMVKVCVVADKFHLKKCNRYCVKFLKTRLRCQERPPFAIEHITQLQPMLIKNESAFLQEHLGLTTEELQSTLFPRVFVEAETVRFIQSSVQSITVTGTASGLNSVYHKTRDGFCHDFTILWDEYYTAAFYFRKSDLCGGDWAFMASFEDARESDDESDNDLNIEGEIQKVMWKSPASSALPFPPSGPWVPVHRTAKGLPPPKIKGTIQTANP